MNCIDQEKEKEKERIMLSGQTNRVGTGVCFGGVDQGGERGVMGLQHIIVYIIMCRNVVMFIHDSSVGARLGLSKFLYL